MKAIIVLFMVVSQGLAAKPIQEWAWQFRTEKPGSGWEKPGFDDSGWKKGMGGFGNRTTPGARVSTEWNSKEIWLRQKLILKELPKNPALYLFHDEDAQVFINGRLVAELKGFVTDYQLLPLDKEAIGFLKKGVNQVAVYCRQTEGGQAIDVHLIDGRVAPELPPAHWPTHPYRTALITEWGSKVNENNAWKEYPRPLLVRDQWVNLNGEWDYAITDAEAARPSKWDGRILVPFAAESKLSGVQKRVNPGQALWYQRGIDLKAEEGRRMRLNFEAVDYAMTAWVNDRKVGSHVGGSLPFSFDITEALTGEDDRLVLRVEDATGGYQLRGKQILNPHGIWYTPVSGIWQTVWAEAVPTDHIESLKVETKMDGKVFIQINGTNEEAKVVVTLNGKTVAGGSGARRVGIEIPEPRLWSPDSPTLYDLEVRAGDDVVRSYFGIREVGKIRDADGHLRFTLNGEVVFHWGPLDQGWWPDGLLTPPSDEAMLFDIKYLKEAGFNMIRKHIKVESRRYYAHCDRVGMMVWQDQVSAGKGPRWVHLRKNPRDAEWPDGAHEQYMKELDGMITTLESHPSIVLWVPFNEAWGQHRTVDVGKWAVKRDPTRLVNIASGGNFWAVGDIADQHAYPEPGFPLKESRFDGFVKVVGEFGGHGWPVKGHLWNADTNNWGYGGLPKNLYQYKGRYFESLRILRELKEKGIAGAVYTQTTDVEGEINGLLTYDRKVSKIPAAELKTMHKGLVEKSTDPLKD